MSPAREEENMSQLHKTLNILQEFSLPLIVGVVVALVVANVDPHLYHVLVDYPVFGEGFELLHHLRTSIHEAIEIHQRGPPQLQPLVTSFSAHVPSRVRGSLRARRCTASLRLHAQPRH